MQKLGDRTMIIILAISQLLTIVSVVSGYGQNDPQNKQSLSEIVQEKPSYSYMDNSQYIEKMSQYAVYNKKGKIVMLGNSITYRVDWSELLNRNDVINRGIGSDITEGFLNRLQYIYSVNPKICYIMGGVNDIGLKIPLEVTVQNIKNLIDSLKQHKIIPVLQSVLYVAETHHNYMVTNQKIERLNTELIKVAKDCNITYLDLNSYLSSDNHLIKEYALNDGIHLTGAGYEKWKIVLLDDLKKRRIKP